MRPNERAVARLRERKGRPAKPLAVMVPWRGEDGLRLRPRRGAAVDERGCGATRQRSADRDLQHAQDACSPQSLAPGLRELGVMLPYSPLHHLLLEDFGAALVATSGNLSGEPVLTEPQEVQ